MDTLWSLLILTLGFIASEDVPGIPYNVSEEYGKVSCNPECGPETRCVKNNTCLPECRRGCGEKGVCIGPDRCGCELGYGRDEEHNGCPFKCNPPCGCHEVCIKPGKCICDKGYEPDKDTKKCKPKCVPPCKGDRFCSSPGVCSCLPPSKEINGTCVWCPNGCGPHGHCVAYKKCTCNQHYKWSEQDLVCFPLCSPRCGANSYCDSPNRCKCLGGYHPNDVLSLSCSFIPEWWAYVMVAIMIVIAVCCVVGLICYSIKHRSGARYYPNMNFEDSQRIIH